MCTRISWDEEIVNCRGIVGAGVSATSDRAVGKRSGGERRMCFSYCQASGRGDGAGGWVWSYGHGGRLEYGLHCCLASLILFNQSRI